MNRPSLSVRVAGSRAGASLLFVLYVCVVMGWYQSDVPWWLALGAVGAALRTLRAVVQVRRYKAWLADWEAMGEPINAPRQPQPAKRRPYGWVFFTGAVLLAVGTPFSVPPGTKLSDTATLLWEGACLYLVCFVVWKLFLLSRRAFIRSSAQRQAKAEDAPVAWLVPRASSSPSRASAESNLPDYAARLIRRG